VTRTSGLIVADDLRVWLRRKNIKARIIINATATPTATPTPAAMAIVCGLELEE
jgi:hypothetical protein